MLKDFDESALVKVFIIHNQIISLVANTYILEIPDGLLKFTSFIGNPIKLFSQNLDCLFDPTNLEEQKMYKYYAYLIGISLIFISALVVVLVVVILKLVNIVLKRQFGPIIISSLLCIFITL